MAFNSENSKMITVRNRGYVHTSRGMVMAPIRTPYREYIEQIWSMLTNDRAEIFERTKDGKDIPLTIQNFDKNNQPKETIKPAYSETPKKEETPVASQPQQTNPQNNQNQGSGKKKNKKNKQQNWQNNQNNQQQNNAPIVPEVDDAEKVSAPVEEKELTPEEKKVESASLEVEVEEA